MSEGATSRSRATMRGIFTIAALFIACGAAQAQIDCSKDADATATLVKRLSYLEDGIRKSHLPPDKQDRLLRQGRDTLVKNYQLNRKLYESCNVQRGAP